jgi:DNA-binding transcriptional MerR regulator
MTADGLRSGQLADAAGVNVQTLRYYERRGLLHRPDRTLGGHRLYPPETVTVMRVIKAAQRLGFTLDEVANLLQDSGLGGNRLPDNRLQARAKIKLAEIDAKLAELHTVRNILHEAVDAGCEDLIECAQSPSCPLSITNSADPVQHCEA